MAATQWRTLAPGLDYALLSPVAGNANAHIHAFRLDLTHYQLQMTRAANPAMVSDLAQSHHALIAINGGFFAPDMKPLGLRITAGTQSNPLKNVSWWGVFYIQGTTATIVAKSNFHPLHTIDFAVQAGPRLLVKGVIPPLKPGISQRSALAIDEQGHVIIVVTENALLSTTELAEILRTPQAHDGLGCIDALNLDGGTSSQLFATINGFSLNIPSLRSVADAIVVTPREGA